MLNSNKTINLMQLVRPNVLQMQAYSSARSEFTGQADIYLDANENPYESGLNRYPDPLQRALKKKIAQLKKVAPEQIFLGNGSDEAIDLLLRIFCRPGVDQIITLPPTYGMYKVSAALCDVAVKTVPLQANFQPNVPAILDASDPQTKMLFLCHPNNPTGNLLEEAAIIQLLENFPGLVVIDEAYIDFSNEKSNVRLLKQFPNLVVLQTFSKSWGLAGIRLGMAFASESIIALFNKVKPPYNLNSLTQTAALEALKQSATKDLHLQQILEQRDVLQQQLSGFEFVVKIYPSATNFLLVKVLEPQALYQFLLTQKIIVRDRSKTLLCDHCLRFTVGTPAENQQLLQVLQQYQAINSSPQNKNS
ncbi:MAG: histidinol-phosphate transaminase [Bacteroidota bacterium]